MKFYGNIIGIPRTIAKIKIADKVLKKAALVAMDQASASVARRAKEILVEKKHIRTGNLRRSITSKAKLDKDTKIIGIIGTDVHYAPYVEALPDGGYLYEALREEGKKALRLFKIKIEEAVQGVKRL